MHFVSIFCPKFFKMQQLWLVFFLVFVSSSLAKSFKNSFNARNGWFSIIAGKGFSDQSTSPNEDEKSLKEGIAKFYDQSSGIWLDVWGDDMHHGYYSSPNVRDHKAAQVEMIERSLRWAYDNKFPDSLKGKKMVDVGCGVGGSSRYIVKKYGGSAEGISLSPFQVKKANELSKKLNLSHVLNYRVADAMKMPFPDKTFDLTWSMESGEHMPNKERFVNELFRVTAPGGRIIIVTWCHRELKNNEKQLNKWEEKLLHRISKAYYLPQWVPASRYVELAKQVGLKDIRQDDWSEYVAPFWPAVIKSALVPQNFFRMLRSGSITFKGAIASLWMREGLKKGVIKFALISGRK